MMVLQLNRIIHTTRLVALLASVSILAAACSAPLSVRHTDPVVAAQGAGDGGHFALLRLADDMASDGRYAAAIPIYRRAHEQNSGDNGPLNGLGEALSAVGQYEEATKVFATALERAGEDGRALRGLGRTWVALGRPELALPLYDRAVELSGSDTDALNGRAVALDAVNRHSEAIESFRQALSHAPSDMQLRNNYGLSLALEGKYEDAITILEDVALAPGATAQHRQNLALVYGLAGRTRAAQRVAAIDLAIIEVEANMIFFAELRGMNPASRRRAVLVGIRTPKNDIRQVANQAFNTDPEAPAAAMARLTQPVALAAVEPEPLPELIVEPEPAPEPEPVEVADFDIPPLVDPTGYAVQIAAYRHASELMPGWRILSERYSDLISHLEPRRSEKDFGERDEEPSGYFYRLNAGPLRSFAEARDICIEMASRGGDCWVRPPEPAEGAVAEESTPDDNSAPIDDVTEVLPG